MAQQSPRARPVQLHVIHDLGGGSAKWLADYCKADTARTNLVLRSFAHDVAMGSGVALYEDATTETPTKAWKFSRKIAAAAFTHDEYRAALAEIIETHGVQALLVSSVIGHSLDVLDTGLPTVVVNHDYFPWCPAINLYYDGICGRCDAGRVAECEAGNPDYNPFAGFGPDERVAVRERFVELALRPHVRMAAPSDSVGRNLKRLEPRFADLAFTTIAHGYATPLPHVDLGALPSEERLRVLVLGQLSHAKGQQLFEAALPRITAFADVILLGCRELGELYKYRSNVQVVARYEMSELPGHITHIRPHVGLLMSVVSETFGYALSELMMLGVPPVATRVGAFAERIRHGENGFLYAPDVSGVVEALRAASGERDRLAHVRANLASFSHRTAEEMVADYHRLVPLEAASVPAAGAVTGAERAEAAEIATVASMWKHIRKLDLELALVNDARHRTEMARGADAESRRRLEERLLRFGREIAEREAIILRKEMQLQDSSAQVRALGDHIKDLHASTSWRITRPVRAVGRLRIALRLAASLVRSMAREPDTIRRRLSLLRHGWREGGWDGVQKALAEAKAAEHKGTAWLEYRDNLERVERPALVVRMGTLARQPLISLVVPVYNPDKDMFRQMLVSVREQIYPYWELCLADDGSTVPYVRQIMQEFAGADRRIRVSFATQNGGVSKASNRALEMASGEFVVLADHDDVIEEQALLRIAESIVADEPDMVYSDEVLVTHDRDSVIRYAYRPAFSPEYLRSHPYIVHLAAFRAELLHDIGGWNEELAISQDYDLILRASERAKRIVHIPEILYRWRIHGSSAGIARQGQVMDVSRTVLQRHLERSGEEGLVQEGPSFNLFDTRYTRRDGSKVAIVIPTKNHGDLLRQCIESIHATAAGAHYDIVVVDHESDDPATRAYLDSIRAQAQVLRYEGAFNFAAINNFAVSHLDSSYTHYLLCNNDIEAYEQGWLERMLELGQHPDVGIVGARLFYPDRRTIQHAGVCIGMFGAAEHYAKGVRIPDESLEAGYGELLDLNHEVAAVTAACLLIRADTWKEVAGFDESIAVGFGDVDLCLRVGEAGFRVIYCAHARLVHHESFTRGVSQVDPHPEDSSLYRIKWKELLKLGDPYYSPGLSLLSTKWQVRVPLPFQVDVRRRIWTRDPQTGRERVTHSAATSPTASR